MRHTAPDLSRKPMLYRFIVTPTGADALAVRGARRVQVAANSESEARTTLAPLPLVFTSRTPTACAVLPFPSVTGRTRHE